MTENVGRGWNINNSSNVSLLMNYSKTCLKRLLSKRQKNRFPRPSIALCRSKVLQNAPSILQYFRSSLSFHLSLRSLFCLFLSGRRLGQVLLFCSIEYSVRSKIFSLFSFYDLQGIYLVIKSLLLTTSTQTKFEEHTVRFTL